MLGLRTEKGIDEDTMPLLVLRDTDDREANVLGPDIHDRLHGLSASISKSSPIEVPVKRADEINQIFDAISYSKGSSVLRMISKLMTGKPTFLVQISMTDCTGFPLASARAAHRSPVSVPLSCV
jgi:hypothetical protein